MLRFYMDMFTRMNGKLRVSPRRLILSLLCCSAVVGCVTEVDSPFGEPDHEAATKASVKAGIEYIKIARYERAHHHLSKAVEYSPRSTEVHNALAILYKKTGDIELEEEHYKKAIRYDRESSTARNNYGAFLFRETRYKEALKHLEKAASDPSYDKRDLAYLNIGRCATKLQDYELAIDSFKKAVRLNKNLPRPYLELADIYFDQGNIEDANSVIKKYGAVARHTPRSLWLGIRIARLVDDKNALASYELALRNLYPDSPEFKAYAESVDTVKDLGEASTSEAIEES